MYFSEQDIDFNLLDGKQFEELCYDLLSKMGYHSITWKQGGSDNGRDIECYYTMNNPMLGCLVDKWFVECKNHTSAINVDDLNSKLAWASAEKPNHLLIIVSSYISKSTYEWLAKMNTSIVYRIHVIEGKRLKELLLPYDDIVSKYFLDMTAKVLINIKQDWIYSGIIPSTSSLSTIYDAINEKRIHLDTSDYVCLWTFYLFAEIEIVRFSALHKKTIIFEDYFNILKNNTNSNSVLEGQEIVEVNQLGMGMITSYKMYNNCYKSEVVIKNGLEKVNGLYSFVYNENGEGIEVLIKREPVISYIIAYYEKDSINIANDHFNILVKIYDN